MPIPAPAAVPATALSDRDRVRLVGVHPDLVRIVERARGYADFIITEGLRSQARQAELLKAGATRTMNSRHLSGHAVDLAARVAGEVRWDWPLYAVLAAAVKRAAAELHLPITWGGDWPTFRDGPHFELPWNQYPGRGRCGL